MRRCWSSLFFTECFAGGFMRKYTKTQAVRIVTECAAKYKTQLLGKNLLFIAADKHKKTSAMEVLFEKRNFMHLTGLKINKTTLSADRFFEMCVSRRLSEKDFEMAADGTTDLKLAVLSIMMNKNLSANSIGDYNSSGLELYTEKLAGSVKGCMGFIQDKLTKELVPNTVLNKDIRLCTRIPQMRILMTCRKPQTDVEYTEIVYMAKKVTWSQISFPEAYTYLMDRIDDYNNTKRGMER